ncbi:glycosyltransferase involved in cell wall biosynthesis [Rhizobium tibeticum]|uniref:glycosyltransferase family 2 protein n=1 Tax=Rhizobium tibeticum TaxID=501024 RepID=UPI002781403A|nr:glycosyltransferase family 2 protein [Rhizobium tibeticum]MDP9813443.1 glycosyltransferase involved in cell wall biosynthesis [Rhizobium tibeticum]
MTEPLVTIAVPSYNQGQFLDQALSSIFEQDVPVEVFVMDGGSTDNSKEVIAKWATRLSGHRSHKDAGQAAAINEGIALGHAKYVCWLNSDDWFLPGSLSQLIAQAENTREGAMVYGRCWNFIEKTKTLKPVWVEPFSEKRLSLRCIIAQPATLIRRSAWQQIGGVDPALHMAMDYDLWWRLYRECGPPHFVDEYVAVNRVHAGTKTRNQRRLHYQEAIKVVRRHHGRVPSKWWLAQPYSVWLKALLYRTGGSD